MRVVILFFLFISSVSAQIDTTGLQLVGKIDKNGNLKLRWFAESSTIWLQGLSVGYTLEKAKFDKSRPMSNQNYQLVQSINSWNKDMLDKNLRSLDSGSDDYRYANIAYQLSQSVDALPAKSSIEETMEYKEQLDQVYSHAMIATLLSWYGAKVHGMAYDIGSYSSKDIYRVRLNESIGGLIVRPAYITNEELFTNKDYLKEVKVSELDESIGLEWEKSSDVLASFVEYSTDGVVYNSNEETPSVQLSNDNQVQDSITFGVDNLVNDQLYYLKIFGYNIFGEKVLIGEAEGTPRDLTPPIRPVMLGVDHKEPDLVEIKWMPSIDEDLAGYAVGRSTESFGQYYQIHEGLIPKDRTSFGDAYFDKDTSNYYIIEAVDYSGNRSRSNFAYVSLTDSIPPDQPVNVFGLMDSIGIVTLEMEPQDEKDFMGYRVYMANNPKTEFSVIQETYNDSIVSIARDPIIIDTSTIESLSPFIYYKIGALDYNYNESEPSEIIKVKRPDIYPPVSPMITGYKAKQNEIHFDIALSTSFDVRQNYIYRREATEEEWSILDSLGIGFDATYIDSTGEDKVDYIYSLKAVDEGGLESEFGNKLKLSILRNDNQLGITPTVKYFEDSNKALIIWEYDTELPQDITSFTILLNTEDKIYQESYRTLEKKGLVVATTVPPSKITIIPQSRKKQYVAVIESKIDITKNKIEDDRDYQELSRN